jgi:hypothetical protein
VNWVESKPIVGVTLQLGIPDADTVGDSGETGFSVGFPIQNHCGLISRHK